MDFRVKAGRVFTFEDQDGFDTVVDGTAETVQQVCGVEEVAFELVDDDGYIDVAVRACIPANLRSEKRDFSNGHFVYDAFCETGRYLDNRVSIYSTNSFV